MIYDDSPRVQEITQRVLEFIEQEVIPAEAEVTTQDGLPPGRIQQLRARAKAAGVYGPQLPVEYGGLGLNLEQVVPVFEAAGRSLLGPFLLNCAAPDEGNMHLLELLGTAEQKEKYLRPVANGDIRSCFCMTEPAPGAGSDPMMIQTRAVKEGDGWRISGRKWWSSGADGAGVYLVMAYSNPAQSPRNGCTIFLVESGNPGLKIKRRLGGLNLHAPGGHCEVEFQDCLVPNSAILGREGLGYAHAQARLVPARLTHCMRWTGVAARALDIAVGYINRRQAFGKLLAEHQAMQWMVADSAMELHTGRLLVRHAARLICSGREARTEAAMAKVHLSEAVNRIVDRAIQMCGGLGVSDDTPLADFYREARAFRIYDGASEVHRMVIARQMLKRQTGR